MACRSCTQGVCTANADEETNVHCCSLPPRRSLSDWQRLHWRSLTVMMPLRHFWTPSVSISDWQPTAAVTACDSQVIKMITFQIDPRPDVRLTWFEIACRSYTYCTVLYRALYRTVRITLSDSAHRCNSIVGISSVISLISGHLIPSQRMIIMVTLQITSKRACLLVSIWMLWPNQTTQLFLAVRTWSSTPSISRWYLMPTSYTLISVPDVMKNASMS